MSKINLTWIAKEMIPGKWYNINDEEQLRQYMQIMDKRLFWPKFQLSLSPDFKQVKKVEI